jgi:sulfopyruvate decarboxylase subunit alpha
MNTVTPTAPVAAAPPVALSISGEAIAQAIKDIGITHVITVPDTYIKSTIAALEQPGMPKMVYVCTEDEAMGVNAGLHIAGHKPMMLIQNNGLYACVNTLKTIALDAQVPTFILIGQYLRDVTKTVEDNKPRAVRLLEPTLKVWDVPIFRLERPEDVGNIRLAWELSQKNQGPTAAIVGAPTI